MTRRVEERANDRTERSTEPSLKGTFASVMLLGAFFIAAWFGVFALYLARN